ncbi:MAG: lysophospholipid acyltransferase family protein [Clostridiales bacterium]
MKKVSYYILYGLITLIALLPMHVLYAISTFCYYNIYYIIRYRRKIVYDNIRNAFPEKSEEEITKLIKDFYRHFCDIFIEALAVRRMTKNQLQKRINVINYEMLNDYFDRHQSVICVTGHFGNWEVGGITGEYTKHTLLGIYKPIKNKDVNKIMLKNRTAFGVIPIPMNEIPRKLVEYKNRNEIVFLYAISDQRPIIEQAEHWLTFFGRKVPVITGWSKIAKKYNFHVLYMYIQPSKRGHYNISFSLLHERPNELSDFQIVDLFFEKLEKCIRQNPSNYLWSHKRWKYVK